MKPSRVAEVLSRLLASDWPVFVWGPPGAGKSSIVRQVAASEGRSVIDIRAPLLEPTDLRGIPTIENGKARWCPPSFLPSEPAEGLLFFDELNAAPPLVQSSLYQLTLDRRVGEYVLPEGWKIIAAGNRAEDRSIAFRMPSALSNRFVHIDFEVDFEDWRRWAVGQGVHPWVVGFLSLRRELLFDMRVPERGFPTPRSWHMASDTLRAFEKPRDAGDVLIGVVGEGAAVEFFGFLDSAITEERVLEILATPATAALPDSLGDLYALVSYLGTRAKGAETRQAAGILLSRLRPELAILLLRDILRVYPRAAVEEPAIAQFLRTNHEVVV